MSCKILGCGSYLPSRVVTNFELEQILDTSHEWIYGRTGIVQRHLAKDEEFSSHMAFEASKKALLNAKLEARDLDLIILCTTTPDNIMPSTANKLQGMLGANSIPSFDIQAVCSGFLYGIDIAASMINKDKYRNVLLVCSEKMSSILDWKDRSTCVLFGDGAGAVILSYSDDNHYIDSKIHSDGSLWEILYADSQAMKKSADAVVKMKGSEVFKNAIDRMASSVVDILAKNHLSKDEVKYFIPHQANSRLIDKLVEKLEFDDAKVIKTIDYHANCSAASIPLALTKANDEGKFNSGDLLLFTAFGSGLTWGSALFRW